MTEETTRQQAQEASEQLQALRDEVETVFKGKPDAVELALVALLSGGHLLIDDVPGQGKTVLSKTLSRTLDCTYSRIQFTPDMLPADVTGGTIYRRDTGEFEFRKGPLFANVILADEVNRTIPRTQSCLLEAMSEYQVTVDGSSHSLPEPFFVMATRNPFESEGTYPLPESQLDRFMVCMNIGYPSRQVAKDIIQSQKMRHPLESVNAILDGDEVLDLRTLARGVRVEEDVLDYIMALIERTRDEEEVVLGGSPRSGIHLYRASQALALLRGRHYVCPDDVKELAVPVVAHRLRCRRTGGATENMEKARRIVRGLVGQVVVPA
ncbi:MAG: MoxR family ATPase [Planctomycetota bacterium]